MSTNLFRPYHYDSAADGHFVSNTTVPTLIVTEIVLGYLSSQDVQDLLLFLTTRIQVIYHLFHEACKLSSQIDSVYISTHRAPCFTYPWILCSHLNHVIIHVIAVICEEHSEEEELRYFIAFLAPQVKRAFFEIREDTNKHLVS